MGRVENILWALVAVCLVVGGAGSARAQQQATSAPQATSAEHSEARALLDAWLASQNQGQFDAYASLYADKFLGIKRAGERETRFERSGWLEDRKRMFKKKVNVSAVEPVFRSVGSDTEVEFAQHWSSGKFLDTGAKRMLLVRQGKGLKIAREEMLRSEIAKTPAAAEQPGVDFHFVITLASGTYVMLHEAPVPKRRGRARADREVDPPDSDAVTAVASVAERDLDARALSWKGQKLRVDRECVGTVVGFAVISRVIPSYGMLTDWGAFGEENARQARAFAKLGESAFKEGNQTVAARLDRCTGTFAQREGSALPIAARQLQDAALAKRAQAAFAALPSVRERQADFRARDGAPNANWWAGSVAVSMYKHPESGQTLISVLASNDEICRDVIEVWALFELRGDQLVNLEPALMPAKIEEVLDVDGDGKLELLVGGSAGTRAALIYSDPKREPITFEYAYYDEPC